MNAAKTKNKRMLAKSVTRALVGVGLSILALLTPSKTVYADEINDAGSAHDRDSRQLNTHIHGAARLMVAADNHQLVVVLESPSKNIVGFEYLATNAEERKQLRTAKTRLEDYSTVFALTSAADCELSSVNIVAAQLADLGDDGHAYDIGRDHTEFEIDYRFDCANMARLNGLRMTVFDHFSSLEQVDVQWAIHGKQGAYRTQPGQTGVRF